MTSTILGGYGFIGSYLASALRKKGEQCWLPKRGDIEVFKKPLGTVYFCIGLTADFRERPYDTVNAHVCTLKNILENANFDKLIYLSSTRVYGESNETDEEKSLRVTPSDVDNFYNITKLMGESLALSSGKCCHVARLSNVIGEDMGGENFIGMLIEEARKNNEICFKTTLKSQKDYIWIDDVVNALISIAENGKALIYNVASGVNVTNKMIANIFVENGMKYTVSENAKSNILPVVLNKRMIDEIGVHPHSIESKLEILIEKGLQLNE